MTTNDDALREAWKKWIAAERYADCATAFSAGWSAHADTVADTRKADEALMRQALEALDPLHGARLENGVYADANCKITFAIAALRARLGEKNG